MDQKDKNQKEKDQKEKAIRLHRQWNGKLETTSKAPVKDREALSIAYTPGVAEPCKIIAENPSQAYHYTIKANTVAVVSDGSAVLGLGNIGPLAAMPVMEGKCVLFKEFADVNAVPICLDTQDTEEIISTVKNIAPCFGGINLEDIAAPRCFEIEERLKKMLDIPVFHDDRGGALRGENTVRVFTAGGLSAAHLGDLGHQLTADQLAAIGPLDAALIPVGGTYTVDARGAKAVCEALAPKCAVPMHYRHAPYGLPAVGGVEDFLALWPESEVRRLEGPSLEVDKTGRGVLVPKFCEET